MTRRISRKSPKSRSQNQKQTSETETSSPQQNRDVESNMRHLANNAEQWLLGGTKPSDSWEEKKKRRKSKRKRKSKSKRNADAKLS